jgi:hypothetical protein
MTGKQEAIHIFKRDRKTDEAMSRSPGVILKCGAADRRPIPAVDTIARPMRNYLLLLLGEG